MAIKVRPYKTKSGKRDGYEIDIHVEIRGQKVRKRFKSPLGGKDDSRRYAKRMIDDWYENGTPAEIKAKAAQVAETEAARKVVPTLREFVPEFMAHQATTDRPRTHTERRRVLDGHLLDAFGDLRLDEIGARQVDAYKAAKMAGDPANDVRSLSEGTVTNHLTVLKRLLNVARRWELIDRVPEISTPAKAKRRDFLTFDESDALVSKAEPEWRVLILVAIRTGLRLGELQGLRWRDLQLDGPRSRIQVEQAFGRAGFGLPKSGKGRGVDLAWDVVEALRQHPRSGELVFPRADDPGRPVDKNAIARALVRAAKAAEIGRKVTPHLLRHTYASHCAMRGIPLAQLQKWLGHSEITTTMRYAHLSPESAAGLADRLAPRRGPVLVHGGTTEAASSKTKNGPGTSSLGRSVVAGTGFEPVASGL